MKFPISILIAFLIITYSCNDNTVDSFLADSQNVHEGLWKITHYEERNKIETDDFQNYEFEFRPNSEFIALHSNGKAQMGSWKIFFDDGVQKLEFETSESEPLDELNDDWDIELMTSNQIKLSDISGGDGHTSTLIFDRI